MRLGAGCAAVAIACGLVGVGCSPDRTAAPSKIYSMGERVQVGPLIYTIMDTEWLDQLGEADTARMPQHRFLAIRLTVTNSGSSPAGSPGLTLIDSKGQSYPELTDGQELPEWLGYIRTIKPADTEHGRVLFDAPTGAYRLRLVNDDPENPKFALVEIPLQLAPAPVNTEPSDFPPK